MVGAFRFYAHSLKRQANLTADVLALIVRGNVHIARVVVGNLCRLSVLVAGEKIKFHFGTEGEVDALFPCVLDRIFEYCPCVRTERSAVKASDGAEHSDNSAMLRTPR